MRRSGLSPPLRTYWISLPREWAVSEHARPRRPDQVRGSSATANEATRRFTQSFDLEPRGKVSFVIHWPGKPELPRITRYFRPNGLPDRYSLALRSRPSLPLAPAAYRGPHFTQKGPRLATILGLECLRQQPWAEALKRFLNDPMTEPQIISTARAASAARAQRGSSTVGA